MTSKPYGYELILDLHDCDPSTFNRNSLRGFFKALCIIIGMERGDLHFWDDCRVPLEKRQTDPKTKGTSAVQFIMTSSLVIHALDDLKTLYINVFSCDDFDDDRVSAFVSQFFSGIIVAIQSITRGEYDGV